MRIILLGFCLISGLVFSSFASAKNPPAKVPSIGTFERAVAFIHSKEFQKMSLDNQQAYIKDLRAFVVAIENVDMGQTKKSRKLEVWFEYLSRMEMAYAGSETCVLKRLNGVICVQCPSFGKIVDEATRNQGSICRGSPEALNSALQDKTSVFPEVSISLDQIKEFKDSDENYSQITVDTKKRDGVSVAKDTAAGTKYYRVPEDRPIEKPSEAEPATKIERVKDDQVVESASNKVGEKLQISPEKQTAATDSLSTLKQLRENFKGNLRCIYAGFPISGSTCEGKTELALKNATYSCTAQADEGNTIAASTPHPKKTILCNPLLFGLDDKNKPFCIAKSKTATKDCDTLASKSPNSLNKTLALNRENLEQSQQIGWTLQALCMGDADAIKSFLQERGSTNPDRSYADIRSTCESFGDRFNSYWKQFDSPVTRATGGVN